MEIKNLVIEVAAEVTEAAEVVLVVVLQGKDTVDSKEAFSKHSNNLEVQNPKAFNSSSNLINKEAATVEVAIVVAIEAEDTTGVTVEVSEEVIVVDTGEVTAGAIRVAPGSTLIAEAATEVDLLGDSPRVYQIIAAFNNNQLNGASKLTRLMLK
jgi:hypothetical protein